MQWPQTEARPPADLARLPWRPGLALLSGGGAGGDRRGHGEIASGVRGAAIPLRSQKRPRPQLPRHLKRLPPDFASSLIGDHSAVGDRVDAVCADSIGLL